jgi:hypothetical protein
MFKVECDPESDESGEMFSEPWIAKAMRQPFD